MGPASATTAKSRRGDRRFCMLTGTGFAQPMSGRPEYSASSGKTTVPIRSMCLKGFRVSRPSSRAVGSPNRSAVQACAASCTESDPTRIRNQGMMTSRGGNGEKLYHGR